MCSNTGYFRKVYRSLQVGMPRNILKYLSIQKLTQKRSHLSIYLSNSKKKFILCFNSLTNIYICKYIIYIFTSNFYEHYFECTQWPLFWRQVIVSFFKRWWNIVRYTYLNKAATAGKNLRNLHRFFWSFCTVCLIIHKCTVNIGVYTRSVKNIYLSPRAQVAVGTFFMKSPVCKTTLFV